MGQRLEELFVDDGLMWKRGKNIECITRRVQEYRLKNEPIGGRMSSG